ncbi:unnamed protein product, partial [Rotaria socialis]
AEGGSVDKTTDPSPPNNLSNSTSLSDNFSNSSDLSGICKELGISKTILESGEEDEDILELSGIIASLSEEEETSHEDCARRITEKNDSQTPDREYWRQNLAKNFSPEMREKAEANRRADEEKRNLSLIQKEMDTHNAILEGESEAGELELREIRTGSIEIPNEEDNSLTMSQVLEKSMEERLEKMKERGNVEVQLEKEEGSEVNEEVEEIGMEDAEAEWASESREITFKNPPNVEQVTVPKNVVNKVGRPKAFEIVVNAEDIVSI